MANPDKASVVEKLARAQWAGESKAVYGEDRRQPPTVYRLQLRQPGHPTQHGHAANQNPASYTSSDGKLSARVRKIRWAIPGLSMPISQASRRRAAMLASALTMASALGGCAVVSVAGTAASLAASGVGLAADAAIGTVRITGRAIGTAADVVFSNGER